MAPAASKLVAPASATKGGRGKGTKDYSQDEILNLLCICNRVLPISGDDWDIVLAEHSVRYAAQKRTSESIRPRKFSSLHRRKIPTGDPHMPREVKLAKHIRYKIVAKADLGDGTEDMNLSSNGVLSQQTSTASDVPILDPETQAILDRVENGVDNDDESSVYSFDDDDEPAKCQRLWHFVEPSRNVRRFGSGRNNCFCKVQSDGRDRIFP